MPIARIVAGAASRGVAMVRGIGAGICPGAARFVFHGMVVPGNKGVSRWVLKTLMEAIIMKILLVNEIRSIRNECDIPYK